MHSVRKVCTLTEGPGLIRTTSLRPTLKLLTFMKRWECRSSESLIFGAYRVVNACTSMDFINECRTGLI